MLYLLIFVHWIADFVCQTDSMAKNKSKSNYWLSAHILVYSSVLLLFPCLVMLLNGRILTVENEFAIVAFTVVNGLAHFCIDYFTSRMTSKLWAKQDVHNFFVVVGFDQALHMCTLILTYTWMLT